MSGKRPVYTSKEIAEIAADLRQLPPKSPPQRLSMRSAIAELSDEIRSLQERGYSIEAVAAHLAERGVPIKESTLRTYLTTTRAQGEALEGARTEGSP